MKRTLLMILSAVAVTVAHGQDFAPSQQAQSYLDPKGTFVDHSTGLLHYSIPIYTLNAGGFELPISLDYTGRGVRLEDLSGIVGYNWNLNSGGVVTRTLRGGFVDDDRYSIERPRNIDPNNGPAQIQDVNNRRIDGENDIFTAVFNGRSVDFIIKASGNQFVVEPLERTNVKITCSGNPANYNPIGTWTVIDEDGNKYYFGEREMSYDILKEDAVSFNATARVYPYTSSWYLSRIEPTSGGVITYAYRPQAPGDTIIRGSGYMSRYLYGRPMRERQFDFSKHEVNVGGYIDMAIEALEDMNMQMLLDQQDYISLMGEMRQNLGLFGLEKLRGESRREQEQKLALVSARIAGLSSSAEANMYIMGQLVNFKGVSEIAFPIIDYLLNLARAYESVNSSAATNIERAAYEMIQCINTIDDVKTKESASGGAVKMQMKLLDSVSFNGKTVKFEYTSLNPDSVVKLRSIRVKTIEGDIFKVSLKDYNYRGLLNEVAFAGSDGTEFKRLKFNYYYNNTGGYLTDHWGLPRGNDPEHLGGDQSNEIYRPYVDPKLSKNKSLSEITTSDGGKITIDYEPHVIYNRSDLWLYFGSTTCNFGGLRTKSLVFKEGRTTDSIKYHYPYPAELVYSSYDNKDTVRYDRFYDCIEFTRAKAKGTAFLKTGNNGAYYGYVEEEFVGKGKKTYLFFTPSRFMQYEMQPYKFWLNGMPLGVATYDANGNLKSMTKNHYLADVESNDIIRYYYIYHNRVFENQLYNIYRGGWFSPSPQQVKYSKSIPQIKAYEYYIDRDVMESYYIRQPEVPLPGYGSIDPYRESYLQNIEPRTHIHLEIPNQRWDLVYGGKVLLKSQEEYKIEGNYSTKSSVDHFLATNLRAPFSKVEYFYDNIANSTEPTRVVTTDSKGDIYTSVIRRIGDMEVSGVLADMKSRNILSPTVKQQFLKGGDNRLLSETVNVYDSFRKSIGGGFDDGKVHFAQTAEKTCFPSGNTTIASFPALDNSHFTYGEQNYTTEKEITHDYAGEILLPVSVSEKGDISAVCYDPLLFLPILKAKGYDNECVSAVNAMSSRIDAPEDPRMDPEYQYNQDQIWNFEYFIAFFHMALQNFDKLQLSYDEIDELGLDTRWIDRLKTAKDIVVSQSSTIDYATFKASCEILLSAEYNWTYIVAPSVNMHYGINLLVYFYGLNSETFPYEEYYRHKLSYYAGFSVGKVVNPNMRLWVLSDNVSGPIDITICHSNGESKSTYTLTEKNYCNIQTLDIDPRGYEGITSVEVRPRAHIAAMVLVPADCEFEAISYNPDGTVFCQFNQNGVMEHYEYDGAGRVVKVFDGNGDLLKENFYHVNLP